MPASDLTRRARMPAGDRSWRFVVAFAAAAIAFAGVPLTASAGVGIVAADGEGDLPVGTPERDASVEDACESAEGEAEQGFGGADAFGDAVNCAVSVLDGRFFRTGCIRPGVACVHARHRAIRGPPAAA